MNGKSAAEKGGKKSWWEDYYPAQGTNRITPRLLRCPVVIAMCSWREDLTAEIGSITPPCESQLYAFTLVSSVQLCYPIEETSLPGHFCLSVGSVEWEICEFRVGSKDAPLLCCVGTAAGGAQFLSHRLASL